VFPPRPAQRPSYAYELFRRALAERDEAAWEYLYSHYHSLVKHWVRHSAAFVGSGETGDALVGEAFARFWRTISPEQFERFSTSLASTG
jgi:hypothetical protein